VKNVLEINSRPTAGLQASMALGPQYTAFASTTAEAVASSAVSTSRLQFHGQIGQLSDQLYNSRASFKIAASMYAMHLDRGWRDILFKQVDQLMDPEEWDERDAPVSPESSLTFLRLLLFVKPGRRPSLGATDDGNLVAAWVAEKNRLTLICQPDDHIRWVLSTTSEGVAETAAGSTTTSRIPDVLTPYNKEQWFANAGA
jgi:hypothetical protein